MRLGKYICGDEIMEPTSRLVQVYYACSSLYVKNHVLEEIRKFGCYLRIVVVVSAFGMGKDCKTMNWVNNFGPSKTVESYLQECESAGCYNELNNYYLLNKCLLSHRHIDMKQYVDSELY